MSNQRRPRGGGRRPTSPASSSASSDSDSDTTHLTLIGTAIDTTERHYRTLRQQRQQQPTQHALQHTGGFTPAGFVSSRQRRWQGEVATVEEYMDDKDVNEQTRDKLQVKADIEGGRSGKVSRAARQDALLLAIAPRHETVARRILRRMGWRDGVGVGRQRRAGGSTGEVSRVSRVRRRPTVAAALPPSMQALLDEDDEEIHHTTHTTTTPQHSHESKIDHSPTTTDNIDTDSDTDNTPLPSDVPLYLPHHKDNYYGLQYNPHHNAPEFTTHKLHTQQLEQRHTAETARDAALMDDGDEVVELVRGGRGSGRGGRGGGVAGWRVMGGEEDEDEDEVEVYEDRAEYDTHIGRLKRDKHNEQKEEDKVEEKTTGGGGYAELVFVKGEMGGLSGAEAASTWEEPRDWDERKVWDEAEEAAEHERMKAVVREWADRRKGILRARQDELRQIRQHSEEKQQSDHSQQQQRPGLPQPPPPPAPAPPAQSTADMLASGFFSRFTMAASSAASTSPSPALPLPPPPPPAPSARVSPARVLRREVVVWDPSPVLCNRLGIEPPPRREKTTQSAINQSTNRSNNPQLTNKQKRGRQRQYEAAAANERAEAEASQLHAPVIATDRPPTAVLSAIFDDVDDRGEEERSRVAQQQWLEAEAMRLLSSITLPDNNAAMSPPSSSSGPTHTPSGADRSVVSGYVHPSRQQQVPPAALPVTFGSTSTMSSPMQSSAVTSSPTFPLPTGAAPTMQHSPQHLVQATASSSGAPRRSRWGDRAEVTLVPPQLQSATLLSPSLSPPPLGPPTPPSLSRSLPPPVAPAPFATAPVSGGSEEENAALKAALLKELAILEQESQQDKARRKEKRRERKRERRHLRARRDKHGSRERRHSSRRSRYSGSGSESGDSSGSSVRTASPPRGRVSSKQTMLVVDLT